MNDLTAPAGITGTAPSIFSFPPPAGAVAKAIAAVTGDLAKEGISKDRKNQQQGYSFRGIEDVYHALAPLLTKHGLVIVPQVIERAESERQSSKGGVIYSVVVRVVFRLIAVEDGSFVEAATWGEAMDSADKATNKAMSAAYKYMAFMLFCIPVEGVEDADSETPPPTTRRAPVKAAAPAAPAPAKAAATTLPIYEVLEVALDDIGTATSHERLASIAETLRRSPLSELEMKTARDKWGERSKWLGTVVKN